MKRSFAAFFALSLAACVAGREGTDGTTAASASTPMHLQLMQDLTECKNSVQQNLSLEAMNALLQYLTNGPPDKYEKLRESGKINARMVDCLMNKGYLSEYPST